MREGVEAAQRIVEILATLPEKDRRRVLAAVWLLVDGEADVESATVPTSFLARHEEAPPLRVGHVNEAGLTAYYDASMDAVPETPPCAHCKGTKRIALAHLSTRPEIACPTCCGPQAAR